MRFVTVAADVGRFMGWPANHGAWQWGNELLVGFLTGPYNEGYGMHYIAPPFQKLHARSFDGGETWTREVPNVEFTGGDMAIDPPFFDLNNPDTIIRVCGRYDTGGDDCRQMGAFYLSCDRGRSWLGPYAFKGLEALFGGANHCTARTRVHNGRVYLSAARKNRWGTDWVFSAHYTGESFIFDPDSDVVLLDQYRAVMPAVAQIEDQHSRTYTFAALRRKGGGMNWIDLVVKVGDGPWRLMAQPDERAGIASTGGHNGNPPALAAFGKRLVLAYANRSSKLMLLKYSDDLGATWSPEIKLTHPSCSDIGYPQMFVREDGLGICVYYFSATGDKYNPQHIRGTIFDPTLLKDYT
mgnify:CR=1 FL=1